MNYLGMLVLLFLSITAFAQESTVSVNCKAVSIEEARIISPMIMQRFESQIPLKNIIPADITSHSKLGPYINTSGDVSDVIFDILSTQLTVAPQNGSSRFERVYNKGHLDTYHGIAFTYNTLAEHAEFFDSEGVFNPRRSISFIVQPLKDRVWISECKFIKNN